VFDTVHNTSLQTHVLLRVPGEHEIDVAFVVEDDNIVDLEFGFFATRLQKRVQLVQALGRGFDCDLSGYVDVGVDVACDVSNATPVPSRAR
jgi:hypothetical protein